MSSIVNITNQDTNNNTKIIVNQTPATTTMDDKGNTKNTEELPFCFIRVCLYYYYSNFKVHNSVIIFFIYDFYVQDFIFK